MRNVGYKKEPTLNKESVLFRKVAIAASKKAPSW